MASSSPKPIPWHLRFRTRLIIAIFPILAAVTAASLWIAESRFSAVYQQVFEAQFQSYIDSFEKSRAERFDAIGTKLEEAARNPTILAHLKDGAPHPSRPLLEPLLLELGKQRLSSESAKQAPPRRNGSSTPLFSPQNNRDRNLPNPHSPPVGFKRGPNSSTKKNDSNDDVPPPKNSTPPLFFTLLDANGRPIPETSFSNRTLSPDRNRQTKAFLNLRSRSLPEVLTQQEVGYKLVEVPGETHQQVREIFVTPIRESNGTFLGALVFGLPLPTLDERALFQKTGRLEHGQILSGIWIEDQIISDTIPDEKKPDLSRLIGETLEKGHQPSGDLTFTVDNRRYRVIYRILNPDSPFERAVQINLYSLASVDAEIADLRLTAIEIGGLAMLASLGLIIIVSRTLSGPVSALTTATHQIASGNYAFRVPVQSRDELGLLSSAFNDMAADLALKERYHSVLSAVTDPAVANRLIHDNHDLGGVQKQVSVLFCDIRGFTSLSEQLPPHDVIELLNHHMTALTEVAYQYGGTVDKFVGDMIMILFGAPESSDNDAQHAVRCALAMRQTRNQLNSQSQFPLEIGIGIATGSVVAGCMGSEKRLNYTVLGHRVNLAARLCGIAAAGQILIDDATQSRLPENAVTTPLPPARLKGIAEEVLAYSVTEMPA
jgi:class 3 adenylate cyclase